MSADYLNLGLLPALAVSPMEGRGRMVGSAIADFDGDARGTVIGDMEIEYDFAEQNLSGRIENVRLATIDGIYSTLGGVLDLRGETNGAAELLGVAGGPLGLDIGPGAGVVRAELSFSGQFLSLTSQPNAARGTLTGQLTGDVDLHITSGVFSLD